MSYTARSSKTCALGVLLLLAGCSVGPEFTRPQAPLSKNWRAKDPRVVTQPAGDNLWWRAFNDPALNRLIELAYRQNLPLQIAGLRIAEARARLGIATGQQFPQQQQLYGHANAVGLSRQASTALHVDRNIFTYELGFDAAWELDFWGKYRRGVEAEAGALLGSVADYRNALVSLTAEVARTYTTVRTFEVLIQQTQENVRLQEEGLRIAESQFGAGATSELDVAQAKTLLESTRASLPELQIGAQQAKNALSTLLGQPTGTFDPLLAGPKQIPNPPAKVAVSVPAEMLRRRPDIQSAEFYAAAQCARIGVAKAELYPSFSLVGTIGLQSGTGGAWSANLFSSDSLFYTVGPQINWPFFNYGRIKNSVRVQDARFQQLLVNYRNTVLQAAQEVEDALVGFLNAQQAVVSQEAAVASALRSEQLALIEYREGAKDYQRVLDAQRALLQEQITLTRMHSAVTTNWIALYKALGGGWELSKGKQYVPETTQIEMKERTDWGDMLSEPRNPETKDNRSPGKQ